MNKQKGFGIVWIILTITVIGLITGGTYLAKQNGYTVSKLTPSNSNATTSSQVASTSSPTTDKQIATGQTEIFSTSSIVNNTELENTYITDKYIYFATTADFSASTSLLQVFDNSDPTKPFLIGHTAIDGGNAKQIYVNNSYAYVIFNGTQEPDVKCACSINQGFQIFDISNPTQPKSLGLLNFGKGVNMWMIIRKSYAYIIRQTNPVTDRLEIIDISNPSTPIISGSIVTYNEIDEGSNVSCTYSNDFTVDDNYANISGVIVDVSDPTSPKIVYSCTRKISIFKK